MKYASIATNDPERDPTPRVRLVRIKQNDDEARSRRYSWITPNGDVVADGDTPGDANEALRHVFSFAGWDLQFHRK